MAQRIKFEIYGRKQYAQAIEYGTSFKVVSGTYKGTIIENHNIIKIG